MEIRTHNQGEVSIITLSGELDASNAVLVDLEIASLLIKKPKNIWIDGTCIRYISSAGLGVFLSYLQIFKEQNINLVFFGLNEKIKNVFTILGLDGIIRIVPDQETAHLACQPSEIT